MYDPPVKMDVPPVGAVNQFTFEVDVAPIIAVPVPQMKPGVTDVTNGSGLTVTVACAVCACKQNEAFAYVRLLMSYRYVPEVVLGTGIVIDEELIGVVELVGVPFKV